MAAPDAIAAGYRSAGRALPASVHGELLGVAALIIVWSGGAWVKAASPPQRRDWFGYQAQVSVESGSKGRTRSHQDTASAETEDSPASIVRMIT
jgi:hypothetical protein